MDYDHLFNVQLDQLKEEGNYRVFAELERCQGSFPKAKNFQNNKKVSEVTVWCSNDYLNMSQHPEVINETVKTLLEYGSGSGGTRNISGTSSFHTDLEE